jgi:two-component system phosphate regulon response regulator PhoB
MSRVLVIEGNSDLRDLVADCLAGAGHVVLAASTGREGLQLAREQLPDIVLLDLGLPDMGGLSVCRQLKLDPKTSSTRVIIVSARGEEIDRVVVFQLGADDYVPKPFSLRELLLRVRAVMRTRGGTHSASLVRCGAIRLDREASRVWVHGNEVRLTSLEFRFLLILCSQRGRVVSRAQLLADVWGIDKTIRPRSINNVVKRLRKKLGCAGKCIQTVRAMGYRAAADVVATPISEHACSTLSAPRFKRVESDGASLSDV